jgi:hypothetical protein
MELSGFSLELFARAHTFVFSRESSPKLSKLNTLSRFMSRIKLRRLKRFSPFSFSLNLVFINRLMYTFSHGKPNEKALS